MSTISQIQIGDTVYDIKDTVARNKPRPQVIFKDTEWRTRNISNNTHWCGNQMIIDTCTFRGILFQFMQGHADFRDQSAAASGTWGQIRLYLANKTPAGSSVEIWEGGNAASGADHWSTQRVHVVKGSAAESFQWCSLHTFSLASYTNRENFSSRTTPCATFSVGSNIQWTINLHANYIFIYFPLYDNDKTELSTREDKTDNIYYKYYFTAQSDSTNN